MKSHPISLGDLLDSINTLKATDVKLQERVASLLGFSINKINKIEPSLPTKAPSKEKDILPPKTPPKKINIPEKPVEQKTPSEQSVKNTKFTIKKLPSNVSTPDWYASATILPTEELFRKSKLVKEPLFNPKFGNNILLDITSTKTDSDEIDIEQLIEQIANGKPCTKLDKLKQDKPTNSLHLLIDNSDSMLPFGADLTYFKNELLEVFGKEKIEIFWFENCPLRGVIKHFETDLIKYQVPNKEILLLALTDLGIGYPPLSLDVASEEEWKHFFHSLKENKVHSVTLVPYKPTRWAKSLSKETQIIFWDRNIDQLIEFQTAKRTHPVLQHKSSLLSKLNPDVLLLAKTLSLANCIEPELLRATRLNLFPHLDAGVEADLYFSNIVEAKSSQAIVLRTSALKELRQELKDDRSEFNLEFCWGFLKTFREKSDYPLLLKKQEEITYLSLCDNTLSVQAILADILKTLVELGNNEDQEDSNKIARWTINAFDTFENTVQLLPIVKELLFASQTRLPVRPIHKEMLSSSSPPYWLMPNLPTVSISIKLTDESLVFTDNDNDQVQSKQIDVPKTNPRVLEVWYSDNNLETKINRQIIEIQTNKSFILPLNIKYNNIYINTINGSLHKLTLKQDDKIKISHTSVKEKHLPAETKSIYKIQLHEGSFLLPIVNFAWSPKDSLLAIVSTDGYITLLDSITKTTLWYNSLQEQITDVCWSLNNKLLALGTGKGTIYLLETENGAIQETLTGHTDRIYSLQWVTRDKINYYLFSCSADKSIRQWDSKTYETIHVSQCPSPETETISWTPNWDTFATISNDKYVRVWHRDFNSWYEYKSYEKSTSVTWSLDNNYIATSLLDGDIIYRSFPDETHEEPILFKVPNKEVIGIALSADNKFLASKSLDNTIHLWSINNQQLLQLDSQTTTLEPPVFRGIAFHPQLPILASLDQQQTSLKVWELNVEYLLRSLDEYLVKLESNNIVSSGIMLNNLGVIICSRHNLFINNSLALSNISIFLKKGTDWIKINSTNNTEVCINQYENKQEYKDSISTDICLIRVVFDKDSGKLNTLNSLQISEKIEVNDEVTIVAYSPQISSIKRLGKVVRIAPATQESSISFYISPYAYLDSGGSPINKNSDSGGIIPNQDDYLGYSGGGVFNKSGNLIGIITHQYIADNQIQIIATFIPKSISSFATPIHFLFKDYDSIAQQLKIAYFPEEISEKMKLLKELEEKIGSELQIEELKTWKKENYRFIHLLQKGHSDWSSWRLLNPDEVVDLSQLDLSKYRFNLNFINFSNVNLKEANLSGVDLTKAQLNNTDLSGAILNTTKLNSANLNNAKLVKVQLKGNNILYSDFSGADFTEADLSNTTLENITLDRANFTKANLNKTQFISCSLEDANFFESYWSENKLIDINLRTVKGLASVHYKNISTLVFSQETTLSHLPQEFLSHCQIINTIKGKEQTLTNYLANLSPTELYCWIKLNLSINQIAEIWQTLLDAPMEDYLKNRSVSDCIILLYNNAKKRSYLNGLYNELSNLFPNKYQPLPNNDTQVLELIRTAVEKEQKDLDLSCQRLKTLPLELFELRQLEKLNLAGNALTELPKEITSLTNLTSLTLLGNQLHSVPPEIGQLSKLKELVLSVNQLKNLPPQIGNLTDLQQLTLSLNHLRSLPTEIGNLTNLRQLHLSNNELTSIPIEIIFLTNLQKLHLYKNSLSDLPVKIGQLINLEELPISDNELTHLPVEIGQLTKLQVLHLHNNHLTTIPNQIGQLGRLRELSVSNNELTHLPVEIGQLTKLQVLHLHNNHLTTIPSQIGQLAELQVLSLAINQLNNLPVQLDRLTNLKKLTLKGNKLLRIPPEIIELEDQPNKILEYFFKSLENHLVKLESNNIVSSGIILNNLGLIICSYHNLMAKNSSIFSNVSVSLRKGIDWVRINLTNIEICISKDKNKQEHKDSKSTGICLIRTIFDKDNNELNTLDNLQISQKIRVDDEVTVLAYSPKISQTKLLGKVVKIAPATQNLPKSFYISFDSYLDRNSNFIPSKNIDIINAITQQDAFLGYSGGGVLNKDGDLVGIITHQDVTNNHAIAAFIPKSISDLASPINFLLRDYDTTAQHLKDAYFPEEISEKMKILKELEDKISTELKTKELENWKKENYRFIHLLQKGHSDWSSWRLLNPDEVVDLSQLDLSKYRFNLNFINFSNVNLKEANLSGINLTKAQVNNADLSGAILNTTKLNSANLANTTVIKAQLKGNSISKGNFSGADFTEADLSNTTLEDTKLDGANFTKANLNKTQFINCSLEDANFTESHWTETKLVDIDLRTAKGLDKVIYQHNSPSIIVFSNPTNVSYLPEEFRNHYKVEISSSPAHQSYDPPKHWLLRTNPHITEISKAYEGLERTYEVVPNHEVRPRDVVYFWRNSQEDIYGWGEIIDNPALSDNFSWDKNKKINLKVVIKAMSSDSMSKQTLNSSSPDIITLINSSNIGLGAIPLSYSQVTSLNSLCPLHRMISPSAPALSAILSNTNKTERTTETAIGNYFEAQEQTGKSLEEKSNFSTFEFETVKTDANGNTVERKKQQAKQYMEDLGNGVILEMVEVPNGIFMMGSPHPKGKDGERPQHQVTIPAFYIGKYQVTQAQWKTVMENNPSHFKEDTKLPVESISRDDAVEFCKRLSEKTNKIYRLPSEAEWEYACRAGTETQFAFGETISANIVNYYNRPGRKTIVVGSLGIANGFGLYDMHGNVWEWCQDAWHDNYDGAPTDGSSWEIQTTAFNHSYVVRGGSFMQDTDHCRSAFRNRYNTTFRNSNLGFRVVLSELAKTP